jgi:hypothetical protein
VHIDLPAMSEQHADLLRDRLGLNAPAHARGSGIAHSTLTPQFAAKPHTTRGLT